MAEETPSLHIDTDWKKQAQEEKRKLAEAAKANSAPAAAITPAIAGESSVATAARPGPQPPRRAGRTSRYRDLEVWCNPS